MFYSFSKALVRQPSTSVSEGLGGENNKPDYNLVKAEHTLYVEALKKSGLMVEELEPEIKFPDSIFVEDPALTFKDTAILLNPGAPSRRGERDLIREKLKEIFVTVLEVEKGFVEGGDVLCLENEIIIGISDRTNHRGAMELSYFLKTLGYSSRIVQTPTSVIHLKSDCSALDEKTILVTPRLAKADIFKRYKTILTDPEEYGIANSVRVNDKLFVPKGFPKTEQKLKKIYDLELIKVNEISKIDAGLSCMSLRW